MEDVKWIDGLDYLTDHQKTLLKDSCQNKGPFREKFLSKFPFLSGTRDKDSIIACAKDLELIDEEQHWDERKQAKIAERQKQLEKIRAQTEALQAQTETLLLKMHQEQAKTIAYIRSLRKY